MGVEITRYAAKHCPSSNVDSTLILFDYCVDIISGKSISSTRRHLKSRPPPVSSVVVSGRKQEEPHPLSTPRAGSTRVEGRAARLAARRSARNEALQTTSVQSSGGKASKRKSVGSSQAMERNKNSSRTAQQKNSRTQPRSKTGRFVSCQRNKRIKHSA